MKARSAFKAAMAAMMAHRHWRERPPAEHHAAPTGLGPDAQLLKRLEHYIYDHPDHWYIWKELRHLEQFQAA